MEKLEKTMRLTNQRQVILEELRKVKTHPTAGELYDMVLIQSGLQYGYDTEIYQEYTFTYKVEPYPESEKGIRSRDYELLMTVTKE